MLLKAFAMVTSFHPECRLVIFGEGQERNKLTLMSADLGISDNVFMPVVVKKPAEWHCENYPGWY